MAEKQSNKDRLREITDSIETGIQEMFESEKYRQYLRTMSRFHKYSVNNTMLIYMQKPDATHVAGFNKWRDQFSRNVMKGEKGIKIIAPTPYKKKIEEAKLDPDTRLPMLDTDGKVIMEEKEIKVPMYKPVTVFDVSQTEGKPLPQLASNLSGNVKDYELFMEAVKRSSPVPISIEAMSASMDGYFDFEHQNIAIRQGMSEVQTVCAAVHEIAHSKLHNNKLHGTLDGDMAFESVELFEKPALFASERVDKEKIPDGLYRYELRGSDDDPGLPVSIEEEVGVNHAGTVITAEPLELTEGYLTLEDRLNFLGEDMTIREFYEKVHPEAIQKSRNTEEVEAESISYAVCAYYGIETGDNSFGYIASWSKGKELPELRASLETINKTASGLITDIDRHYLEIQKERGIELSKEKEYELVTIPPAHEEAESFAKDYLSFLQNYHVGSSQDTVESLTENILLCEAVNVKTMLNDLMDEDESTLSDEEYAQASELAERYGKLYRKEYMVKEEQEISQPQEAIYLIDDTKYLHVQTCEDGFDYTFYDMATLKEVDGGQIGELENAELFEKHGVALSAARDEILLLHEITPKDITHYPSDMTEKLLASITEANAVSTASPEEQAQEVAVQEREPLSAPDNGYVPDPAISIASMNAYGYTDDTMLPLSKERALELMERDLTVYMLYEDNTEAMAFDAEEIQNFDGLFGIERTEWEAYRESHTDPIAARPDYEAAFLKSAADAYAIYQLKEGQENRSIRFESLTHLEKQGLSVERERYDAVYAGELKVGGDTPDKLNDLFTTFNIDRPADFTGHSLSTSDIIALKQSGVVSCHYVDSWGFKELPGFLPADNYLKNAEMAMEDDYGMIDGIINNGPKQTVAELEEDAKNGKPISLMDLAEAVHREKQQEQQPRREESKERPSILAKLKATPISTEDRITKTAPKRSAERER